jgi:hypothetical protein
VTTHDFTKKAWGHNVEVMAVIDGGLGLRVAGWAHGVERGDLLLLPNGQSTTRYRVEQIDHQSNPRDMWFADLSFAPRVETVSA